MNTRIIEIRKSQNLTQEEFAKRLNLSRNYVWMIEKGERIPADRTISDICRIFDIQEDWLRYGLEPMRAKRSKEEEIAELVGSALNGSSDFKAAVIRMICTRTEKELEALADALNAIYENIQKEESQSL